MTAGADKQVHLWDVATLRPRGAAWDHPEAVSSAAFTPDGKAVLSACCDHILRLWDIATGQVIASTAPTPRNVIEVVFNSDCRSFLAWGDAGVREWDITLWETAGLRPTGSRLRQGDLFRGIFSPDGRTVLTSSSASSRLWRHVPTAPDAEDSAFTLEPLGPSLTNAVGGHGSAFSPDSKTFATLAEHGRARLWDTATGQPVGPLRQHIGRASAVAFHPDGRTLVTAGSDGALRPWPVPPPVPGDLERLKLWVEVLTARALDRFGAVQRLSEESLTQRSQRLEQLGGAPVP